MKDETRLALDSLKKQNKELEKGSADPTPDIEPAHTYEKKNVVENDDGTWGETTTEEETDFDVDTDKGGGDASQPTTIVGTDIDHTIFVNNQDLGASSLNETFAEYKDYIRFNATGKMGRDKVVITGQSKHKPGDELFTLEFDYSNEKKQKKELARFNKWLKTQSWYKV